MVHIDESVLLAYVDREASEVQQAEVARHVAACGSCARELHRLRDMAGELSSVMASLDVPPRMERARARFDAARRELGREAADPAVVPIAPRRVTPAIRRGVLQAAVLALVLAGVAGAAIPGSPLRAWIASAIDALTGGEEPAEVAVPAPTAADVQAEPVIAPTPTASDEVTVFIPPAEGEISIILEDPPEGTRIRVRLTDAQEARLRANVARPRSGTGWIRASGIGLGEIQVDLPRSAMHATIAIGDEVVLRAENGTVVETADGATAVEDGVILQVRP